MKSNFDVVLEDCLEQMAQGETVQACLSQYPEHAPDLEPLLYTAIRFDDQAQVRPSGAFRSKTRAKLYAHMEAHPRGNSLDCWEWKHSQSTLLPN